MIRCVRGNISIKSDSTIVVQTQSGIGYRIFIQTGSPFYKMTEGEEACVHTSMVVKEDSMSLYGFYNEDELEVFELLITVSGIGAKGAMAIMSVLSIDELKKAIAFSDVKSISKANGIGKKTAERLILELKDKIGSVDSYDSSYDFIDLENEKMDVRAQALEALMSLGYTKNEAASAIGKVKGDSLELEDYIKFALKNL